jgi:hypothetical protein
MSALDDAFREMTRESIEPYPIICCLHDAERIPSFTAPMLRDPAPPVGQEVTVRFVDIIRQAIALNEAIHDGAIMATRISESRIIISGWSYRLFPPDPYGWRPTNRGSAFNSCFAMSVIEGVERVYLHSKGLSWCFQAGQITELSSA